MALVFSWHCTEYAEIKYGKIRIKENPYSDILYAVQHVSNILQSKAAVIQM